MANSSIKKNFMYQMIYDVLVMILPFVTSPYISRVVGAEGLGVYAYSYSIAFYFVLFSMLGLKNYGNRAIAMVRDDKKRLNETFSNIVTLHFIVSVICFAVYIGYIIMMKGQKIYAIIQIGYVLSGLLDISWFYFGIEKFKMTVARSTIIRFLNVICIFVFVHEDGAGLERISEIFAQRHIEASVDEVFALDDVNKALKKVAGGKSKGKTIIKI